MLHLKNRKSVLDYKKNSTLQCFVRQKVDFGVPVERYSRCVCLWQIVHKRGPAASCWWEGKRLWLIVIHHFQSPVSIKRHGVTWKIEKISRHGSGWYKKKFSGVWRRKDFLLTLLIFIGASRAAAVTRFQTVVVAVQVAIQTTVDIQVCATV